MTIIICLLVYLFIAGAVYAIAEDASGNSDLAFAYSIMWPLLGGLLPVMLTSTLTTYALKRWKGKS